MKSTALVLCMAAGVAAYAQTAARPATTAAKSASTTHTATTSAATAVKYPPGIKPALGVPKTAFSLRYQDLVVGTGAEGVPMKMYKLKYTGWRAADGVIFDSWDQHPMPVMDQDGKPVMGDDGKPKMNLPQPASFPIGVGRMIPGFDYGVMGMHVGGKRRLFIPWQLAYGARSMPDRGPDHPGIPAKSDLVFDVELVAIEDLPMPQGHPGMPGAPPSGAAPHPATPPTPPPAGTPPPPSQPATPPQPH